MVSAHSAPGVCIIPGIPKQSRSFIFCDVFLLFLLMSFKFDSTAEGLAKSDDDDDENDSIEDGAIYKCRSEGV